MSLLQGVNVSVTGCFMVFTWCLCHCYWVLMSLLLGVDVSVTGYFMIVRQ